MFTLPPESRCGLPGLIRATLSGALGLALLVGVLLLVEAFGSAAQGPLPPASEPPAWPEGVDVGQLLEDLRAGVPPQLEPVRWPESAEVSRLREAIRAAAPPVPAGAQAAVTLCVNPGTPGCYTTIQAAIDAAGPGTIIEVAAGTYHEHITVTKDVGIYGAGWDNTTGTIIDGDYTAAQPVVYISGVSASTVISGVQVRGGGTAAPGSNRGGGLGIWYASPRIVNTMVYSCTASDGGGVSVWHGQPLFQNVAVLGCRAASYGGGYYLQDSEVAIMGDPSDIGNGAIWLNSGNEGGGIFVCGGAVFLGGLNIYWNSAPYGGGISVYYTTTQQVTAYLNDIAANSAVWHGGGFNASLIGGLDVAVNYIRSNTVDYNGAGAWFNGADGSLAYNVIQGNTCISGTGGGVAVDGGSAGLLIQGNLFQGNDSRGGALSAQTGGAPTVDANTFVSNTSNIGGAIWTYQAGEMEVTNNIIARNIASATAATGGGVAIIESPAEVINNTIADNTGDGIFYSAADDAVIVNNILSGNSRYGLRKDTLTTTTGLVADYNDFYDNTLGARSNAPVGAHDRLLNPTYVASGNPAPYYHIQASSPVSQTGSTTWAPTYDFDGERRRTRGTVSMGADEIPAPPKLLFLPLVLKNSP